MCRHRQTDRDRWMMTQREKEIERGSSDWSVSTVAWFPLFVGVCGLFAVPNQCWNLLHSSPVPIHNTHIHINSYMHPLSPDASPSLPSLASKKTFPGKNECWWLPHLKPSVFFSFIMSVCPYHLFSCVIYCVFPSQIALCCLFIDCDCIWINCTDWLEHWWFHFGTWILGSVLALNSSPCPHMHTQSITHFDFFLTLSTLASDNHI